MLLNLASALSKERTSWACSLQSGSLPTLSQAMDARRISDLPDDVKRRIAAVLDAPELPNWRWLIRDVIRPHIPLYNEEKAYNDCISRIGMETLLPGGSPTLKLLNELGQRGITVGVLKKLISSINERPPSLQTILNLLCTAGSPKPIITKDVEREVQGTHGQHLHIHCEASGQQPLHFQWFKKKEELHEQTGSTLTLHNVWEGDEGYYICRVANQFGCIWTSWAQVIVTEDYDVHGYSQFDLPVITSQPDPAVPVLQGSQLRLYCDGVGRPAPSFQWYHNDAPIREETNRVLTRTNASTEDQGVYFCKVYNTAGETLSQSTRVHFIDRHAGDLTTVTQRRGPSSDSEQVANKVALLIGNKDYRFQQLGRLFHPINDVCDLNGRLVNMGFKVVSLVNLTLKEMREALVEFCKLLVEDTYAVFYFAGHGFERGGRSYLMPIDATESYRRNENMASAEVLRTMQATEAKLNVVLLDCCRTEPDPEVHNSPLLGGDLQDIKEPNVVVAFGCCPLSSVFECEQEKNGFFAKHLLKNITDEHRNKSIEEVLLEVSRGIHEENLEDPITLQRQVVNRITTSVKPMTTAMWQSAHEIPNEPVTVFQDGRVKVELIFNAEVSNVLIVNARALGEDDLDLTVTFHMSDVVSGCSIERGDMSGKKLRPSEATLKVKDLQRLTEPLVFQLQFMYTLNFERQQKSVSYRMEGKPLYAKLVTRWGKDQKEQ
ncbi:hypothetical protein ACROYT_G001958 [Oculina patagonica]